MRAALWVFLGGGLGSVIRYVLNLALARWSVAFPWSILVANVVGSFLIGLLAGLQKDRASVQWLFLATGMLGGFTTFSTFSLDTLQLLQTDRWPLALAYTLGSVLLGVAAAFIGFSLASTLSHA
jgi:fluoride exporter